MDSAGKDGAIKHVMTGVNPQGCKIVFVQDADAGRGAPRFSLARRARIAGARRHRRVQPLLLRGGADRARASRISWRREGVYVAPGELDDLWAERFHSIRAFERHLTANGTRIVKIFLHISKDEQMRRLQARIDDPEKAWKASRADVEERKFWKDYQRAYELALAATSVDDAPWHIVPADDKKNARLFVSQIVIEAMKSLKLDLPPVTPERKRELKEIRAALEG